jgi:hypothetical protein
MAAGTALIALEPPAIRPAHARGHSNADTGTHRAIGPSPEQPHIAHRNRKAAETQTGRGLSGTGWHCVT